MIVYRGYEVSEDTPGVVRVVTDRSHVGKAVIGGFATQLDAFRFIDSLFTDLVHPWRTDLRELVKLMNGEVQFPHAAGMCPHCCEGVRLFSEAIIQRFQEEKCQRSFTIESA